jgi:XTP/dITP diphosphohydrolase
MSATRILLATGNPGKVAELAAALEPLGFEVVGLDVLDDRTEVEETGETFEANARLKAEDYSTRTEFPVLADDSGLEVDALGGDPGVRSARYGGPDIDDRKRYELVLERLRAVPPDKRTARFRCVLVVARAGRTIGIFEGVVEGRITDEPRGEGGFGYDPVFFHEGIGRTFGEIGREEKETLSHRGQAIRRFVEAVRQGSVELGIP